MKCAHGRGTFVTLAILTLLLSFHVRAEGMTYYVSSTGDDSNSGTAAAEPWRTIERANRGTYTPGDSILFRAGDAFDGNLVLSPENADSSGDALTLGSYGEGRATIEAADGTAVLVRDLANVQVRDLAVVGSGGKTNTGSGVEFRNELLANTKLEQVRIHNVEACGFGEHGIVVQGQPSDATRSGFRDVRITACVAHGNVHTGILVRGVYRADAVGYANEDVYVGHCVAYDNSGVAGYHNHSGNGIFLEDVDGGMIERCVAYNNGFLCDFPGGGPIGIWAAVANDVTIQFCESHHNRTQDASADGGGFDFDGGTTNSIMQYNYSHDNDGAGYLIWMYEGSPHTFRGNICRYNISQNDARKHGYGAIHCGGDISDCAIYNNTIYMSPAPSGRPKGLKTAGRNMHFCNNIFVTAGDVPVVEGETRPSLLLAGNNYWNVDGKLVVRWEGKSYGDLADWRAAAGQERVAGRDTGLSADPLLRGAGKGGTFDDADLIGQLAAYRLRSNSPMIDAGLDLPSLFGIDVGDCDYFGGTLPRGEGWDIGAHESG